MNHTSISVIEALHLSKVYDNHQGVSVLAVSDVSLNVQPGEIVLICGPNGSGKTTLLSMLGCLIKLSSGSLFILGQNTTQLSLRDVPAFRLRSIGFIFQAFRLLDSLTVIENVELVLNLAGIRRPESRKRARSILEEFNIAHRERFLPHALSGGEKQRVAIARALANDPPLLLADEPTGSLDSSAGQAVIQLLCDAARQRGKTVLIVSHDPRIQQYADTLLAMEDGRLLEKRVIVPPVHHLQVHDGKP